MPKDKEEQKAVPSEIKSSVPSTSSVSFEEDEGSGSEQISQKDQLIPFINILQKLSPQLDKRKPTDYIEGAEEGFFFNSATKQFWNGEDGIIYIPFMFSRRYTVWVPRTKGGGLVADYGNDDSILKTTTRNPENNKEMTPEGNEVVTSLTYYGLHIIPTSGQFMPAVLSMSGTQQKKARQWNTMITNIQLKKNDGSLYNPAMFYMSYKLTSVPESNDKGTWMGFKIAPFKPTIELPEGESLYLACRSFKQKVLEGLIKADASAEETHEVPAGSGDKGGDDIPF